MNASEGTSSSSGNHGTVRRMAIVAALTAVAIVAASCSSGLDLVQSASGFDQPGETATPSGAAGKSTPTTANKTSTDATSSSGTRSYADVLKLSIVDIQEFWRLKVPEVFGGAYTPIPNSSMYPYDSLNLPPPCGGEQPRYQEIAGNAFYCSDANYIAWDDGQLFPKLSQEFGSFSVALVLAHEWGHAVQGQLGLVKRDTPTVLLEQQADCFAGAWTRRIADGESALLELGGSSLDSALAGLLAFRDEPGMLGAGDNGAHGSGFDRVRAFRDGYEQSLTKCETYSADNLVLTEFPFSDEEYKNGGNMEINDLANALVKDMNAYFTYRYSKFKPIETVDAVDPKADPVRCDGDTVSAEQFSRGVYLCEPDSAVFMDTELASNLYRSTGDFAISVLFGDGWARRVQLADGMAADELLGKKAYEQRLCMIGGYAGSLVDDRIEGTEQNQSTVPGREAFSISGGDLDEAITSIMSLSSDSSTKNDSGELFKTVGEFQKGVVDGHTACDG